MNKNIFATITLFFGGFGIHRFILGKPISGILYLLFAWTLVPAFISFVEAITYFSMTQDEFEKRYNAR
ncbi:MAG TPA: NINE protein [Gammaproteobacteria bacterium]|nr:NINE protein [Gammaproteobacteria bacterium]